MGNSSSSNGRNMIDDSNLYLEKILNKYTLKRKIENN